MLKGDLDLIGFLFRLLKSINKSNIFKNVTLRFREHLKNSVFEMQDGGFVVGNLLNCFVLGLLKLSLLSLYDNTQALVNET